MLSFLISIFFLTGAQAAAPSSCTSVRETKMGTYLQRTWIESSGVCALSVSPADGYKDMVYRDYTLSSDGMFMVFNLYGNEGEFGVRDFFMFPRTGELSYEWKEDTQEIYLKHVTGAIFKFDARDAKLKSISDATVQVSDHVLRTNRGGVEIVQYGGLLVDVGFALNKDPGENREGLALLKKDKGQCKLKNKNLFANPSDGDVVFRHKNDAAFFTYLKSVCPGLKL
ncbi:hypothetical protein [Bdellovibrio bacteriovorus]|uniref:hypothetical protein n=1 Tax=Bdellovibrio bacteriovorus TaxID=959 RepID=UPI0035A69EC6